MSEQIFNTRIVHKHDIEANWNKAMNFIPKQGELIVYDIDENYNYERFKIGDGFSNVKDLPFAITKLELDATLTMEGKAADAKTVGDAITAVSDLVGETSVSDQISNAIDELGEKFGSIDIELNGDGTNIGEAPPINANTLNGKHENELYVAHSADSDKLGGVLAEDYIKKDEIVIVRKNYCVVGVPTVPEDPTENMIWVNTNISIGAAYFSDVEPKNMAPGDLWVYTGKGKSNTVSFESLQVGSDYMNTICPINAKQMVDGELVERTTKIWQNGEWTDWWLGELYENGDQFEGVTGGWTSHEYACDIGYAGGTVLKPDLTFNNTNLYASIGDGSGVVRTSNLIDVTNFSTLRFSGSASWSGGEIRLCLWPDTDGNWNKNAAASLTLKNNTTDIYELAIEDLSGRYYIGFGLYYRANVTINNMKLLRSDM